MRPVLHGDVVAAACVLLRLPAACRPARLKVMLAQTDAADRYRKRCGRGHPKWGNGSLMAAARRYPARPEPMLDDPAYCACLVMVFEALIAWRVAAALRGGAQARAQAMQVRMVGSRSSRLGAMSSPHSMQAPKSP